MSIHRKFLLATTVIAGLAMAAPAFAWQDAEEDEETEESAAPRDRVVVTGSRIARTEFTSTQPIQVITAETAALEGLIDTSEILQGSTIANTATQIGNFLTGFVTQGGPGVNTVSLRGLGAQRTLVLLNGRRAGPAGTRGQVGAVDLNTIPSSQIARIEILTDGASSIYGSDAVAGVVNIITRDSQDGGNVEFTINRPFESGGEQYRFSASQGWTGERGYLTLGVDYYRREALRYGDRDYLRCFQDYVFDAANPRQRLDVVDPTTGDFKCTPVLNGIVRAQFAGGNAADRRDGDYMPDPTAVQDGGFLGGDITGWRHVAGGFGARNINVASTQIRRDARAIYPLDSPRTSRRTALSPVERYTFTAFAGYDLTPNVEIYGEFMFNRRESEQNSFRQLFPTVSPNHPDNPFGGPFNGSTGTGGAGHWGLSVGVIDFDQDQTVDYYRGVAGIRGSLANGWDWDLVTQFSRSEGQYGGGFIYEDRVYAAEGFDAILAGGARSANFAATGCDPVSLRTSTTCIPINWFTAQWLFTGNPSARTGSGFTDAQAAEWLFGYDQGNTVYEHAYVEGVMSGELFNLPAGPIGAAVGFQLRRERINDIPADSTLGIGASDGNPYSWGLTGAGITRGSDTIREAFAEFEVPLLRGAPLAESLTLNLSGRFSDYDSYGDNTTYKVGVNWQFLPEWRLRASQGTSFRAPALFELFLADQTSFAGQAAVDPCINWGASTNQRLRDNCASQGIPDNYTGLGSSALVVTGGGAGILEAETAEARTIGLIWTPGFADFSVAVDYFEIEVTDEVSQFGAGNIVSACYNSETFPNDPFCTLFVRDMNPASPRFLQILEINNSYVNISTQTNRGIDVNTRYQREFSFASMRIDTQLTWILEWNRQIFDGFPVTQQAGRTGSPRFVGNIRTRFDRDDWTFFWSVDMVSNASNAGINRGNLATTGLYLGQAAAFKRHTEFYATHNVSVVRRFDQWSVQLGVQNVFGDEPPRNTSGGIANIPLTSQYDLVGRRAFMTVRRAW